MAIIGPVKPWETGNTALLASVQYRRIRGKTHQTCRPRSHL